MGKFGWDLPPGVTHRMIEEQARGDAAAEAFTEQFFERLPPLPDDDTRLWIIYDNLCEWCWQQVSDAYGKGYKQGMDDEAYAQASEADQRKEKEG